MTGFTRVVAIGALLGAVACGQPGSAPQGDERAADATALAADPTLAAESASQPARLGIPVSAKPMSRLTAQAADERVTVVVQLQGDSVAEVRGQSPDQKVSETTRQTIVSDLRRQQDGLRSMIEAYGGEVQGNFQHALNGIRVSIPASKLGSLSGLPGMVAIKNVALYEMTNAQSVPYIGAPDVWQGPPGFHGEGIKVAIIDTGLDYTHANFGGPGTSAAYDAAHAAETAPANPAFFGPAAPKVKGGTDLVGDSYNANPRDPAFQPVPHPDPNPLDCNGHGSHVGGTTAGFGLTTAGATYTGPYDATTPSKSFRIGPGVAPKADLYAVRVFGCGGSTDVVVEAIDWAVEHDMQVVNMSLGSDFGVDQSADAVASTNAEKAGVIIVASAGNAGRTVPYIVGSPSVGNRTLSIAAVDSKQSFPGATVVLRPSNATQTWQDSNDQTLPSGSLTIQTLRTSKGAVSLGCVETEYMNAADGSSKVSGKLVVAIRGTCARVYRVQAAFAHGAASAALVNNNTGYPSFEGDIMSCTPGLSADNANGRPCEQQVPANGVCARGKLTGTGTAARCVETPELVTIPFFGVRGKAPGDTAPSDGDAVAASASADTFKTARVANPTANQIIGFSSSGPRSGYDANGFFSPSGHLKPDLAAPGVSILSTASGTGNGGEVLSGTSMAAPHVSGVAALALQSHPSWPTDWVRLAIANTASPTRITGWSPRQAGAGLVQPLAVTRTSVVARGDTGDESNLSFGAVDFLSDFTSTRSLFVANLGSQPVTFNASTVAFSGGRAHTATVMPATFTLGRGNAVRLQFTLTVPAATAGSAAAFREVGGFVKLAPATGSNGDAALNVPYYFVPRARSDVSVAVRRPFDQSHPSTATVRNASAAVTGLADFYSWGAVGHANKGAHGIRALGVKTEPCTDALCGSGTAGDQKVTFAVNTFRPNSQYAARNIEYDVDITLAGNTTGTPDFTLFTADLGLIQGAAADGRVVTVLVNNKTGDALLEFIATAPTDGSLLLIPMVAGDAGLTSAAPRFTYSATAFFRPDDTSKRSSSLITDTTGTAKFNAFTPSVTATSASGPFPLILAPGAQALVNLTIDAGEFAKTPTRGVMVVARENANSRPQALLSKIGAPDDDEDDDRGDNDERGRVAVAR